MTAYREGEAVVDIQLAQIVPEIDQTIQINITLLHVYCNLIIQAIG
jgi:hypothetical protein